jgi:hypothetical protein
MNILRRLFGGRPKLARPITLNDNVEIVEVGPEHGHLLHQSGTVGMIADDTYLIHLHAGGIATVSLHQIRKI